MLATSQHPQIGPIKTPSLSGWKQTLLLCIYRLTVNVGCNQHTLQTQGVTRVHRMACYHTVPQFVSNAQQAGDSSIHHVQCWQQDYEHAYLTIEC